MTPLDELPFVNRTDVYKNGVRAATLERTSGGTVFLYLDHYGGLPIATTLPLGEVRQSQGGSLPTFGSDTTGDVQVMPADVAPSEPQVSDLSSPGLLSFETLWNTAVGAEPERTGLPGIQPKVSARMISFPVRFGSGQFILKLNPPEFPYVVENEACFFAAAKTSGLRVPRFEAISDRDGVNGLLISRFDRVRSRRAPSPVALRRTRVQVLDRYPAAKYSVSMEAVCERFGGPVCRSHRCGA